MRSPIRLTPPSAPLIRPKETKLNKRLSGCLLVALALSLALSSAVKASPILIANASFETLPEGGLPFGCGGACRYSEGAIPGWANTSGPGAESGQWQPGPPPGYYNSVPDGVTVVYTFVPTISQVVGTATAGLTYTLLVDIGRRNTSPWSDLVTAQLKVGSNVAVATGIAPTLGNWSTFTAIYLATAADAGQNITIELTPPGLREFDNVRLSDDSVIPEPASLLLLSTGLAGAALARRRRRA